MNRQPIRIIRSIYVLMFLSAMASPLQAADFTFAANPDKTLRITGYKGTGGAVKIPSEINGAKVTVIGKNTFKDCAGLTSVIIPDSITAIENGKAGWHPSGAFSGCASLTNVTFGRSVSNIGNYAFFVCSGLTSVTLPDNVTRIGRGAFANCSALKTATLGNGVTTIGYGAFEMGFQDYKHGSASALTGLTLGNSITMIGPWAFQGCYELKNVVIPDSVTEIGNGAFRRCASLKRVTIGSGVSLIGRYVFSQCKTLTSLYFRGNTPHEVGRHLLFRAPDVTVYYLPETQGWGKTFCNRPTARWKQ